MRHWIGIQFVKLGMAIIPADTRRLVVNMIMYHVPGGLSADEKAEVEVMAAGYRERSRRG